MAILEVILIALALVIALAALADRLQVPYPILLLTGGIALGFIPGLPAISIDPSILFLLFIPPLVFSSGWRTSWRDFRANLWPISLLSVGLVLATIAVVAVVARLTIGGLTWPAAFVLGAVVSSTDPVAATAIAERLHLPQRIVTLLEGEGVGNDAASLVAYRSAVAATVTGIFVLPLAALEVVLAVIGGIAIGVVVALVYDWIADHLHNAQAEVALTLVVPFAAYIPADRLGVSGVLAVLVTGILGGRRVYPDRTADTRLAATGFWESLNFVLNGLIFVLLGVYLPGILAGIRDLPAGLLALYAAVVFLTLVLVRATWVFAMPYFPGRGGRLMRQRSPNPPWKAAVVVTWSGMRGADTLVIALALPLTIASGAAFPDRALIIFLTFCTIAMTLVGQGLTLPALIGQLGLRGDDTEEREEAKAHLAADRAALARLDELLAADGTSPGTQNDEQDEGSERRAPDGRTRSGGEHLRGLYIQRLRRHTATADGAPDSAVEADAEAILRLRRDVLEAQRQAVIALRDRGEIGDDAMRHVLRDLDLEEEGLE
jgi:monovalent cation/hydrogen antiporter